MKGFKPLTAQTYVVVAELDVAGTDVDDAGLK